MLQKGISLLFAGLTWWFVYVNLNDPDPILWGIIYGSTALIHTLALFEKFDRKVIWVVAGLIIAYALTYFPFFMDWVQVESKSEIMGEMQDIKPYIEGTREFGGLLIAGVTLIIQNLIRKK